MRTSNVKKEGHSHSLDGVPFPVEFHGTEGEENLSNETPSYENMAEAIKILELIQQISKEENQDYKVELSSICVVAFYPAQVIHFSFSQSIKL